MVVVKGWVGESPTPSSPRWGEGCGSNGGFFGDGSFGRNGSSGRPLASFNLVLQRSGGLPVGYVGQCGGGNVAHGLAGEEALVRRNDDVGHHEQQRELVVVNHLVAAVLVEILLLLLVNVEPGRAHLPRAQSRDEVFRAY